MRQACCVEAFVRDETGQIVTVDSAQGTTDDGGATVTVGLGYLPNIGSCAPADIKVTVYAPAVENQPAQLLSRTDDVEAATQTLVFDLSP